jgi:ribokinase
VGKQQGQQMQTAFFPDNSMLNPIFVIGSSNTDMVVKTNTIPVPGETKLGGVFSMHAGGKGANQAVAVARLGGQVSLVTKLGNDIFGKQSIACFTQENIHIGYIFIDEENPSGTALIMVDEEGENCIVVAPGANANLMPADIDRVKNLGQAATILMQLEIPMATVKYVAGIAKANGQKLILNPAPAQKLNDELLNGLFLITPNETEALVLTGITVKDVKTASEAAGVFLSRGVQNVVITMGSAGVYFQNKHLKIKVDAPPVKAMDTTAAGDVFSGAIAVGLTEGLDWDRALAFAVQAASISVTRMGAQSSIPYRKEVIF